MSCPPLVSDEMTIKESILVTRLKYFTGYGYDLTKGVSYPWPLPGIEVTLGLKAPKINCCTFIEALLVKAWEDVVQDRLKWNMKRHRQMMIHDKEDLFSPITAVIEEGMALPHEALDTMPPPWTLVQGWRDLREMKGGHTFLIAAERNGVVLTLEANASYGLSGIGFRGLGNAEAFGFKPPPDWWRNPGLWKDGKMWTWQDIRRAYPALKLARLKVKDLQWDT